MLVGITQTESLWPQYVYQNTSSCPPGESLYLFCPNTLPSSSSPLDLLLCRLQSLEGRAEEFQTSAVIKLPHRCEWPPEPVIW